ncbi:MAG TPA: DUF6580 family putative transport protein [Gemmataceae bacterium]|nr:DUF6580 family putative transport protein [Gemmataceae bacterium]
MREAPVLEQPQAETPSAVEQAPPERGFRPLALGLSLGFGLLRLLPHTFNLTPMGAVSLFGGARLPLWQALLTPLGLMAFTDLILYAVKGDRPFDPFVYGSFVLCALMGRLAARSESPLRIGGAALLSVVVFFVVSNFGVWLRWDLYPHTLAGLGACYLAGLEFEISRYFPTLLGYLVFTPALFGAHALLSRYVFPAERVQPAAEAA